ncbi:MAG: cation:proton antiporter [Burkholderiales bacterium]|nr:cation:proton antiporter [Burkholderiales bacterium]
MEHHSTFLIQASICFFAAVVAVLVAHRLGLGSVAGYLVAGIVVGPAGLALIGNVEDVRRFAELGVVFLLFVIGLELEPRRLWGMRMRLATLGLTQVLGSVALIAAVAWALGVDPGTGLVAGMALALSSTALAMQPLAERGGLATQGGQSTFSILLFQDLAVIPMLALLPLLGSAGGGTGFSWQALGFSLAMIAATLVGGHFVARRVFRHIARTRQREVFTAFALLLVLGIALGFEHAGMSMALGAFLAGVLLADSEYRHEIEAAVEPFKGLLLGLFFMSVGMGVEFAVLFEHPLAIAGLIGGLFALKGALLWLIARGARLPRDEAPLFILLLAQGGEFAFVILGLAAGYGAMPEKTAHALTLAVALSMLATPFLLLLHDRALLPRLVRAAASRAHDVPEPGTVIIAGLGRIGQVVARILHASGVHAVVLDDDPDHVEQSRKFGFRVFYGDITRLDLLRAAGADTAGFLIAALDDPDATLRLVRTCKKHFPHLRIIARARDMHHLFELRDSGADAIERETFRSSLRLGEIALTLIGGDAARARRVVETFVAHDEEVLAKLYEIHRGDPDRYISVSNELRDQLAVALREDASTRER